MSVVWPTVSRGQEERSIYGMLRAQIAAGGDLSTFVLPDDEAQPGRVKFAPGAWDGVISHHVSGDEEVAVDALFAAIRGATKGGLFAQRRFTRLVGQATDPHLLGVIDPLLDRARAADDLDGQRLHQLAARLATEPAGRGPVKLGIALLGLFPVDHHREILLTLGRHDEFTLYAAVALSNGQPNPDDDLWTLAREVDGWGRIHLVERLANTERADILDWILRDGFRNSVMDEYLAYIAASRGDLLAALSADHVDDELLYAAGDLLVALFNGGPAQDINDYADGATVTHIYLNLMRRRAEDLRHLLVVGAIRDFVTDASPEKQWPRRRLDSDSTRTVRRRLRPAHRPSRLAGSGPAGARIHRLRHVLAG